MRVIIDKDIPFLNEVFPLDIEVLHLAPEEITSQTVRDADALFVRTRTRIDKELLEKFKDCKYFCDENLYYELDPQSVQFDLKLIELIEDVCSEARIRKWIQDWDID